MSRKKKNSEGSALGIAIIALVGVLAMVPKAIWLGIAGLAVVGVVAYVYLSRRASAARQAPPSLDPYQQQAARREETAQSSRRAATPRRLVAEPSSKSGQLLPAFDARVSSKTLAPLAPVARWLPMSEGFTIAGRDPRGNVNVPAGFVYFGTSLPTRHGDADPCLIDPTKPITANGDFTQRQTNYWPTYSEVSPSARRAYLNWLADGRSDPRADIGYVFLYFYGLERRAIVDAPKDSQAARDLPAIAAELRRLLSIYGTQSGSFSRYAGELLDWVELAEHPAKIYLTELPTFTQSYELPVYVRLGLGQAAIDGAPIPAEFALGWARAEPNVPLRTPAVRCPDQFEKLFIQKYASLHGKGMVLPRNRTKLKFVYRPASSGFRGVEEIKLTFGDIPDVSVLTGPIQKLRDVVEATTKELEAYSRYLGKNPTGDATLEALLQLPASLWPDSARAVLDGLSQRMGSGMVTMAFQDLLRDLDAKTSPTREKVAGLARALESMNIGLEPDVLAGAKLPKAEDKIVLFATDPGEPSSRGDPVYQTALLTVQLASAVAAADGEFSVAEMGHLRTSIQSWAHLTANQKKRLLAQLRLLMSAPASLISLKKKLEPLSKAAREAIALFMMGVAHCDEVLHPQEIKLLEKAYRALGLDPGKVIADLHELGAGSVTHDASPTKAPSESIQLDAARLNQLRKETEKVSALLATIFDDANGGVTDAQPPDDEESTDTVPEFAGILGLDEAHSALARMLLSRPLWSRAELQDVSADLELMLDGALERINDASFEAHDTALAEGDDPVEVNQEVLEKIAA